MNLPDPFRSTVIATYENGSTWLLELPDRVRDIAGHWSLTLEPPFLNLSYNYVVPAARSDGSDAVLKLGPPNPELCCEMDSLRIYDGQGAARLLERDPDAGALLVERLRPGTMLSTLEDDPAMTSIAAGIMRELWRPLPKKRAFPSLTRWFAALTEHRGTHGGSGPIPSRLFEEAESLFTELNASQGEPVLLHGDIHHFNLLQAERAPWLAIDPKGLAGEREFDTAQFLLNPCPHLLEMPDPGQILGRRIDQFADELGFDRARIRGWGIANAVLSVCWGVAHNKPVDSRYDLACSEILSKIRV